MLVRCVGLQPEMTQIELTESAASLACTRSFSSNACEQRYLGNSGVV
ncbi:hypothetical protein [Paenibacillus barengoltzii]|nr:hypothetical protein [Paenibacillus barengoltzii]